MRSKTFFESLAFKTNRTAVSLEQLASEHNIVSLEISRKYHDLSWLYKLLNSLIIFPDLLSQIPLRFPQSNTRGSQMFYPNTYRNNYSQFAPNNRMLIFGNSINNFDFFHDNLTRLKSLILNVMVICNAILVLV